MPKSACTKSKQSSLQKNLRPKRNPLRFCDFPKKAPGVQSPQTSYLAYLSYLPVKLVKGGATMPPEVLETSEIPIEPECVDPFVSEPLDEAVFDQM